MPLSLLTTQTLAALGQLAGTDLAAGRFRPNFLVEADSGPGFPEDTWVGRVLRIGGLRMRVDLRDRRCVMVTIDPVTLARNPAILRAIARERDARLGVYGSTVEPGRVAVGDPVELEPQEALAGSWSPGEITAAAGVSTTIRAAPELLRGARG
jgi:uncharacterized protein YcbX